MSRAEQLIDQYLTRPLGTRQAVGLDKLAKSFNGERVVNDPRVPVTGLAYRFRNSALVTRFFNRILGIGYPAEVNRNEQTVVIYDVNPSI